MNRIALPMDRERALRIACALTVVAVLAAKLLLVTRINVNWDEFYFLSHVHALERGELTVALQGVYTHLFTWVTRLGLDEIGEIGVLRAGMWLLLVLSCVMLFRLARRWASATGAWFALLAFLASWPALKHGSSFRADSMLLPLLLAALLVASAGRPRPTRDDFVIGLLVGVALALTLKAALFLPALIAVLAIEGRRQGPAGPALTAAASRLFVVGSVSAATFALLLAAHAAFVSEGAERTGSVVARAVGGGVLDVPWLPRWQQFRALLELDWPIWVLLGAGLAVAWRRRLYGAAACTLSLLPALFYRNAYPYFFVVMMAPACVVAGVAIDELRAATGRLGRSWATVATMAVVVLVLLHSAWDGLMTLRFEGQSRQKAVVVAVHRIFPEPVPYLDHSGMIASFPKANFFMSTWGVEAYQRNGADFMPAALAKQCPPLLLVNHPVLAPGTLLNRQLRDNDRQLLETSYVGFWGPIRVAGTTIEASADGSTTIRVPCAGLYRLESDVPIRIEDKVYHDGSILRLADERQYQVGVTQREGSPSRPRLVWAGAQPPPAEQPPKPPFYEPL